MLTDGVVCVLWYRLRDGGGALNLHRVHGLPDGRGPDGGAVLHLHPYRYWLLTVPQH